MPPKVCVVLLNWNNWQDTSRCIASLRRMRTSSYLLLVVDNGSSNNSVNYLRGIYPDLEILETGRNLGFAGGCNVGIRHGLANGADFIWLLNNDTEVHPDALNALIKKAEADSRLGGVGSAIYSMTQRDRLQVWGGGHVNFWLGRSRHFKEP